MNIIETLEKEQLRSDIPVFAPGDKVRVHAKIVEGNRERIQVFEGRVIARQGVGVRETFTVRRISYGIGVERLFPVHSPRIAKIEVVSRGVVRRAKLTICATLRVKLLVSKKNANLRTDRDCFRAVPIFISIIQLKHSKRRNPL